MTLEPACAGLAITAAGEVLSTPGMERFRA
jgi:hypothetical protein